MARGKSVFARIQPQATRSLAPIPKVNDLFLHALFARIALQDNSNIEFETHYDKESNTIELSVPDGAMPLFDEFLGMQQGPKFRRFVDWLTGILHDTGGVTKAYVDLKDGIINVRIDTEIADRIAGDDALDLAKVNRAGDIMTGVLTLSGAPTVDLHASTKKYVDDTVAFQMTLGGKLNAITVPLANIGVELVGTAVTLFNFQARRGVPGILGTTTIQLEKNGSLISGAILSWTPSDGSFSLKSIVISVPVVVGDYLSFRLTSKETNAEDIYAETN